MRTERMPVAEGVALTVDLWPAGNPGGGRAFVLVHGLASNARMWHGVAGRLAALGHPVAAVDQRGHGRSDKPDAGYDMDTACADLLRVVAGCSTADPAFAERPVLAGQSWGANVVLELGWRHPADIGGVACVDGGTIELASRFPAWEDCAAALAPPRTTGTPLVDLERYMRANHPDWPEDGIAASLANFEVRDDGTVAPRLTFDRHMQLLRALWEHRPSSRYAAMEVPVLLVPADDPRFPGAAAKRASVEAAAEAIPRCRVHWFSPADHDIHAQHPGRLADLLHAEATAGLLT